LEFAPEVFPDRSSLSHLLSFVIGPLLSVELISLNAHDVCTAMMISTPASTYGIRRTVTAK